MKNTIKQLQFLKNNTTRNDLYYRPDYLQKIDDIAYMIYKIFSNPKKNV